VGALCYLYCFCCFCCCNDLFHYDMVPDGWLLALCVFANAQPGRIHAPILSAIHNKPLSQHPCWWCVCIPPFVIPRPPPTHTHPRVQLQAPGHDGLHVCAYTAGAALCPCRPRHRGPMTPEWMQNEDKTCDYCECFLNVLFCDADELGAAAPACCRCCQ
jgi:hypothetical protein